MCTQTQTKQQGDRRGQPRGCFPCEGTRNVGVERAVTSAEPERRTGGAEDGVGLRAGMPGTNLARADDLTGFEGGRQFESADISSARPSDGLHAVGDSPERCSHPSWSLQSLLMESLPQDQSGAETRSTPNLSSTVVCRRIHI